MLVGPDCILNIADIFDTEHVLRLNLSVSSTAVQLLNAVFMNVKCLFIEKLFGNTEAINTLIIKIINIDMLLIVSVVLLSVY